MAEANEAGAERLGHGLRFAPDKRISKLASGLGRLILALQSPLPTWKGDPFGYVAGR
jgi:hypothetical protein